MVNHAQSVRIFREVLDAMPKQPWKDGTPVDWGTPGNKARARYAAALMGIVFEEHCTSCDSDLLLMAQREVKAADAFKEDRKR